MSIRKQVRKSALTFWLNEARGGTQPNVEWKVVRWHFSTLLAPEARLMQVHETIPGMPTRKALAWHVIRPIKAGEVCL